MAIEIDNARINIQIPELIDVREDMSIPLRILPSGTPFTRNRIT